MKIARTPAAERDELFESAVDDLRALRGSRLLLTGGTGFVGRSLLESIAWANDRIGVDVRVVVLTRDAAAFGVAAPHLASGSHIELVVGDVRSPQSLLGSFDGVIHAATPASAELNRERPFTMLETIFSGGHAVLELAARSGKIPFLFTSSGAIYGLQPPDLHAVPETYDGAPNPLSATNAYHEGKRLGEMQCAIAAQMFGLQVKIARLFAFVGPYLPLDRHFAIGNFIRDGLAGRTIGVAGDGTAVRSYLYSTDMVAWLWAIFVRGEVMRAYNVGSSAPTSIEELAEAVAAQFANRPAVTFGREKDPSIVAHRYVPNVTRIKSELAVRESVALHSAIARTIASHRQRIQ